MKIIIDDKIPFIRDRFETTGAEVEYLAPDSITQSSVADADALIVRTRTRIDEHLLKSTRVKFVATATIGTDHIDTAWCEANGIRVENAAGCNAPGVAQYVWSSLLRQGFKPGRDKLGVVGMGHVGEIVTSWGRLMGSEVLVCDPPKREAGMEDEDYHTLEELLISSDAITLHTPLTKEGAYPTYHLLGRKELQLLHPNAILINTSRGPVVDNKAWTERLRKRDVRAIVDVWEGEPQISNELLQLATYATPHIAGYSLEGKQRATRMVLESTARFFGMTLPTDDLEGNYTLPQQVTDNASDIITGSYEPEKDDMALRMNPERFELLRSSYSFRPEPKL